MSFNLKEIQDRANDLSSRAVKEEFSKDFSKIARVLLEKPQLRAFCREVVEFKSDRKTSELTEEFVKDLEADNALYTEIDNMIIGLVIADDNKFSFLSVDKDVFVMLEEDLIDSNLLVAG